MRQRPLVLELGDLNASVIRAAAFLLRDRRIAWSVRIVASPQELPGSNVLRLEAGSMVRPLVTVVWGGDGAMSTATQKSLALTQAVWFEANPNERWKRSSAPLPERSFYGTPDQERPWVLLAPGLRVDSTALEHTTGLSNPQLHLLRPRQAVSHRHAVYWWPSRSVLASLLGHVDAVVAPNGPLAWDALRIGAPHFAISERGGVSPELADRRLARLVPETLVQDRAFWQSLVTQMLDGTSSSRWGTTHWLHLARERAHLRSGNGGLRIARKLRKLKRDPVAFFNDSKVFKAISRGRSLPAMSWPIGEGNRTPAREVSHQLFDPAWYLKQLSSPLGDDEPPLAHYLRVGAAQGLSPHPLFDVKWYSAQLKHPLRGESALEHYLRVGAAQGLSSHPLFDVGRYVERVKS
jgi:hypothetical protein